MIPPPPDRCSAGLSRLDGTTLEVWMPVRPHRIGGVRPGYGPPPMTMMMVEVSALPAPVAGRWTVMVMADTQAAPNLRLALGLKPR